MSLPLVRPRTFGRLALSAAMFVGAAAVGLAVGGEGRTIAAAGEPLGAGGEYHPVAPVRVYDSRDGALDGRDGAVTRLPMTGSGSTFEVQLSGAPGLPAFSPASDGTDANVLAVAVNITVINPTQVGYLQAYGSGATAGESSLVNFYSGQFVPNSAILRPGANGKLTVKLVAPLAAGQADVAIDLFGWFSTSSYHTNGARVVPAGPGRIFDSRAYDEAGPVPLEANEQVTLPIRGADATNPTVTDVVPADDDVVGVLINITGVNNLPGSSGTFVSALPAPVAAGATPSTSNLNLLPGQVRSVMAIVPVGPDGSITVFNLAGQAHVVVDVVGYLLDGTDPATRAGRVVPLVAPYRAIDTRSQQHGATPLGPGRAETWSFQSFAADVKIGGESVGPQLGLLGNLTATELARQYPTQPTASFLTAYPPPAPGATAVPEVSNITIAETQTMPNLALLRYGADSASGETRCTQPHCVRFYNAQGYLHYLLDVSAVILSD